MMKITTVQTFNDAIEASTSITASIWFGPVEEMMEISKAQARHLSGLLEDDANPAEAGMGEAFATYSEATGMLMLCQTMESEETAKVRQLVYAAARIPVGSIGEADVRKPILALRHHLEIADVDDYALTDDTYVALARDQVEVGAFEIDDHAMVSKAEDGSGAFVAAWCWVDAPGSA